ncbi:uncharacterized protein [Gossypium hirsutum]|uniref:Retrotransposon gag domain-containing protein n=1 Tax=Gossypium hirsutum TaxID=3635 RepID=A0ABM2ZU39_GOSHI|nr:uncharacterized protein LOC121215509 [Gossypium hirsutum]
MGWLRNDSSLMGLRFLRVLLELPLMWLNIGLRPQDLDCTLEQKLKGAMPLLQDEAYQWWLTVKEGNQPDRLTWGFFKTAFQGKYVGAIYMDAQRRELLNLTQGDKSVAEYESEFLRHHQGECWKRFGACLRCRSMKHRIRDCPQSLDQMQATGMGTVQPLRGVQQLPRGHGRGALGRGTGHTEARQPTLVYAARHREGRGTSDVITACTMSVTLGIMVENTASEVTVLSPLGQSVRVNKLFKDVPLEVQGMIFLADLMELPFGGFDLILGMDWLVKHQVELDCTAKRVVLKTVEDDEVVEIKELRNYLSNMISALRAEKLVRKGCEAYLAYISISDFKVSSIKDIRTVKDFLDVFPDELPGLPPNHEVDFGIELLPGTALVSIAPYRMAPKELVELKAQIQEILD